MDPGAELPEVGESSTGITRASITHNCVQFSDLHERILCVSEGFLSLLLCVHNLGIETSDLHDAFQNPLHCEPMAALPEISPRAI